MRKLLFALLLLPVLSFAQGTATNIRNGSTLPTACASGDIFYKTTSPIGTRECSVPGNPGTWRMLYGAVTGASGSDGYVQFASSGAFSSDSRIQFDVSTGTFTVGSGSTQGLVKLFDGSSHYVGLKSPTSVTSYTWLFPAADASGCLKSDGAGNLSVASCATGSVTTTGSPASGNLAKFSGSATVTNGDLSGDATTSGTLAVTVTKVNGVSHAASPATDSVEVVTASNTATAKVIPDCTDTSGNHLNYTQSTHTISCGTSSSGGGGSAGALVLLEEHTASSSASLNLTTRNVTGQSGASFQSDYDQYVISLVNIVPATNSVTLYLKVSTDGGSTYLGSTNYQFGYQYFGFGTSDTGSNASNGAAQFSLCGTNIANTTQSSTTSGVNGKIQLFNPLASTTNKWFTWDVGVRLQTNNYHMYGAGSSEGTTAVNALQILFSSGNIASGTIRLYGVAK